MRFKTKNENIHWEDTGCIKVHNFPANNGTYSYITRTYKEWKKDSFGYKEVDGEPIYFHNMTSEQVSLAIIMGTAQNALQNICEREKFLTPVK